MKVYLFLAVGRFKLNALPAKVPILLDDARRTGLNIVGFRPERTIEMKMPVTVK
jgi:hypothetical protein